MTDKSHQQIQPMNGGEMYRPQSGYPLRETQQFPDKYQYNKIKLDNDIRQRMQQSQFMDRPQDPFQIGPPMIMQGDFDRYPVRDQGMGHQRSPQSMNQQRFERFPVDRQIIQRHYKDMGRPEDRLQINRMQGERNYAERPGMDRFQGDKQFVERTVMEGQFQERPQMQLIRPYLERPRMDGPYLDRPTINRFEQDKRQKFPLDRNDRQNYLTRTPMDRISGDRQIYERQQLERYPMDRQYPMDIYPMDIPPMDRQPMERPPLDRLPIDRLTMDRPPIERPPMDKPSMNRPPSHMDRHPMDRQQLETPHMSRQQIETLPMDIQQMDRQQMDRHDRPWYDYQQYQKVPIEIERIPYVHRPDSYHPEERQFYNSHHQLPYHQPHSFHPDDPRIPEKLSSYPAYERYPGISPENRFQSNQKPDLDGYPNRLPPEMPQKYMIQGPRSDIKRYQDDFDLGLQRYVSDVWRPQVAQRERFNREEVQRTYGARQIYDERDFEFREPMERLQDDQFRKQVQGYQGNIDIRTGGITQGESGRAQDMRSQMMADYRMPLNSIQNQYSRRPIYDMPMKTPTKFNQNRNQYDDENLNLHELKGPKKYFEARYQNYKQ